LHKKTLHLAVNSLHGLLKYQNPVLFLLKVIVSHSRPAKEVKDLVTRAQHRHGEFKLQYMREIVKRITVFFDFVF
jgi:hypothetical protein